MHAKDNFIDNLDKDYKIIKIGWIKELVIKTPSSFSSEDELDNKDRIGENRTGIRLID